MVMKRQKIILRIQDAIERLRKVVPDSKFADELEKHPNVQLVKAPSLDISATFIRDCIKNGQPIRYMVPEEVEEYIQRKKFYL